MSEFRQTLRPAVAIVGGGPAGLTAASELGKHLGSEVLVIEREQQAGGIPRHSNHTGFGVRDLKTCISGPAYARRLVANAEAAGVAIMTRTQVTAICEDGSLAATWPKGRIRIVPRALVLATGARERPRSARLVPGDRGSGIMTTGQLQNMVYIHRQDVGTRAVVVGAELVSWSAVLTLRTAGVKTVALVSRYSKGEAYTFCTQLGRILFGTRVITNSKVVALHGKPRITGVRIENLRTGARQLLEADTVVFTGDWIPDHELARMRGLQLDPVSKSPLVDSGLRTSANGVFAIGNLLHPVETADVAALDGRHVAPQVLAYLSGKPAPTSSVELHTNEPFRWVFPKVLHGGDVAPPRERLLLWTDEYLRFPLVEATQAGRVIGRKRLWWPAAPGRVFRVHSDLLDRVDYSAGPVTISVTRR